MGISNDVSLTKGSNTPDIRVLVAGSTLSELAHLDLSGRVHLKDGAMVGSGTSSDMFCSTCVVDARGQVKVAAKRLRLYLPEDIKLLLENEISAWAKLSHENLLPLLGFTFDDVTGYPVLVSEWMENRSAWEYARRPECDILRLIIGTARGLVYLHQRGVVHSDIKSDNVLVSRSGDARICDFGYVRLISSCRSLANLSASPVVTSRYLAYELLAKPSETALYTTETDVWAFGMTVYELLTLRRPYENMTEKQVFRAIISSKLPTFPAPLEVPSIQRPEVINLLQATCEECWKQDPEARVTMFEVLQRLNAISDRGGRKGTLGFSGAVACAIACVLGLLIHRK